MATPRVRDIIQRDRPLVGRPDDTICEAAARMAQHRCGSILVCEDDRLRGIFTERDVLTRVVAAGRDPARTRLVEVMTPKPDTIEGTEPAAEAVRRMDDGRFRHLPVLEDDRVLGVISLRDELFEVLARLRPELDRRHALAERIW